MKGSFQIAKVFGIPVQIHWSFSLIILYIPFFVRSDSWNIISLLFPFIFILALFTCVVLHEFGHALTARLYGVKTKDIVLFPIGGLARLDRLPEKPKDEFWVAFAGPLVNVGIALIFIPILFLFSQNAWTQFLLFFRPDSNLFPGPLTFLDNLLLYIIGMNMVLAIFNLIPAFPMDGGRILRALLAIGVGRLRATRIAVNIGRLFAIMMVIMGLGLWDPLNLGNNFLLAFVGVFVFVTATNEYQTVKMDAVLNAHQVKDILRSNYTKLYLTDPINKVLDIFKTGSEKYFLVFDHWQNLQGILQEEKLLEALKEKKPDEPVQTFLSSRISPVLVSDSLKEVFNKIHWEEMNAFPVYSGGNLVGIIDISMLNDFLALQQKLNNAK